MRMLTVLLRPTHLFCTIRVVQEKPLAGVIGEVRGANLPIRHLINEGALLPDGVFPLHE